jgi:protoporphyrinogen oxidase
MKFGDDYHRISAAWLWNRVVDRKGAQKGKDVLGYINGSYKIIFDSLIKNIKRRGGKIKTNISIEKINISDGQCTGVCVNGKHYDADIVLSTVPLPSFLSLTPCLPKEYMETLSSIKYQGSVCVVLKLKKALSQYYWINVSDSDSPFVGIIEHTNFISPEQYGNRHIVYLTRYSSSEDPIFSESDTVVYKDFIDYLKRIFPRFSEQDIEEYWVFKDRFSQPVFVRNYSKIMPDTSTPIKNLYMLNTAQIYPQSRSVNSSIAKVRHVIKEILSDNEK